MKKTLITLATLAAASVAQAALECPATYTWDFSNPQAVMGGNNVNFSGLSTAKETINGVETTAIIGSTSGSTYEVGSSVFYDALNAVEAGTENVTLTFSFDIKWDGEVSHVGTGETKYEYLLHIGPADRGLNLGVAGLNVGDSGDTAAVVIGAGKLSTSAITLAPLDANTWTHVDIALTATGTGTGFNVSTSINGGQATMTTLGAITWDSNSAENFKYTIANARSGYHDSTLFDSRLANLSVAITSGDTPAVPEPTTATLSLLALAGLAARRRRK